MEAGGAVTHEVSCSRGLLLLLIAFGNYRVASYHFLTVLTPDTPVYLTLSFLV